MKKTKERSEQADVENCILFIKAGADEVESQNWAQMLLTMYQRWAERNNLKTKIIDLYFGKEPGIKSVRILFTGVGILDDLKRELGVHSLTRISPFDPEKRRHTSFASVSIYPDINEGNHIRSYILHPYKKVKDLQINVESKDVDAILDGELGRLCK